MSYICKTLACLLMGITVPLRLDNLHEGEIYSRLTMYFGVFFVMISGFIGASIGSLLVGSAFDTHEKRIQIFQQMCSRGIIAYMLSLQSLHYNVMHFVLITGCFSFLILETIAKLYLVYHLKNWG